MTIKELPQNALVLLLDADSISYSITHQLRNETDFSIANFTIDDYVLQLFGQVSCSHYCAFLGGTGNFRYQVAKTKPYKGNRPELGEREKQWKQYINEYLVQKYAFQRVNNIEADDAVSITTHQLRDRQINHLICSNDKDVDQVWGNHYSMNKRKFYHIDQDQASFLLHKQLITGDATDNISGLPNKGKVYADKLLNGKTREERIKALIWAYQQFAPNYGDYMKEQIDLLTMLTTNPSFTPEFQPMNLSKMSSEVQVFDI